MGKDIADLQRLNKELNIFLRDYNQLVRLLFEFLKQGKEDDDIRSLFGLMSSSLDIDVWQKCGYRFRLIFQYLNQELKIEEDIGAETEQLSSEIEDFIRKHRTWQDGADKFWSWVVPIDKEQRERRMQGHLDTEISRNDIHLRTKSRTISSDEKKQLILNHKLLEEINLFNRFIDGLKKDFKGLQKKQKIRPELFQQIIELIQKIRRTLKSIIKDIHRDKCYHEFAEKLIRQIEAVLQLEEQEAGNDHECRRLSREALQILYELEKVA